MDRWVGRVAIVTGASSGIGQAIARLLVERGMRVVAVARREDRLKELCEELKNAKGELHALQGDVTQEKDVIRTVKFARETLGGADVLVNNAGVYMQMPLTELVTEQVRQMLETNILGLCVFTREVIRDMRDRGVDDGHIFHISSVAGERHLYRPDAFCYSSTKHAVRVMTEGLRRELRDLKTRIKVTSLSPGIVRTEIFAVYAAKTGQLEQVLEKNPSLEPLDVAHALEYALSTPPHVQVHNITIEPLGERI